MLCITSVSSSAPGLISPCQAALPAPQRPHKHSLVLVSLSLLLWGKSWLPILQLVGPVSLAACDSSTLPSTYLLASFVSSEVSHARDRITQTYILSHTKLLPGGLVQSLFLPSEPEVVAVVSHIASSAKLTTHNHISQNGEI